MATPSMPNIPGAAVVTDTLDFVKNLWGSMSVPGMNIPGMTVPTLSVDELDKKINDLKAVESWLNLNMSMLRGSIQALEVQRGTIATLKSVGATLAATVQQPDADTRSLFDAMPYAAAFFQHSAPAASAAPKPKAAENVAPPAPAAPEQAAAVAPPAADNAAASPMSNPAAWWNLLQDQFQHAVTSAMAPDPRATAAGAGAKTGKMASVQGKAPDSAQGAPAAARKAPAQRAAAPKRGKADKS